MIYDGNIEYGRCCLLLRHTIFTFVLRLCTRNRKGYARMLMYKPAPTGRKTTVERAAGGRRKRKDRSMRPIDADVLKESFVAQIDYYKNIAGITCSVMASAYEAVLERIDNEPTMDAVPIPCKIGDTVYYCRFDKDGYGWITPCVVTGIHISLNRKTGKPENYLVARIPPCMLSVHIPMKDLGARLFLSREEAEREVRFGERTQ